MTKFCGWERQASVWFCVLPDCPVRTKLLGCDGGWPVTTIRRSGTGKEGPCMAPCVILPKVLPKSESRSLLSAAGGVRSWSSNEYVVDALIPTR